MKITVIGCGNAFSKKNYNSSFLLEENGKRFVLDIGSQIPAALDHAGVPLKSIDAFYVSHAHCDHAGGLEEVAFTRYDWVNHPKHYREGLYAPELYANAGLMKDLWEHTLSGGLKSMEGFDAMLETFFKTHPVNGNEPFFWEGWKFELVQQIHIITGTIFMPTYGVFISKEGHESVFFTTDCQYAQPEPILAFYRKASHVFQDTECVGVDTKKQAFCFGSGVHANFAKLAGWPSANAMRLDDDIKAKLHLVHYQDFVSEGKDCFGNECDWDLLAMASGIVHGFAKVGDVLEV